MKQQINEVKRMQQLAGVVNEEQLSEAPEISKEELEKKAQDWFDSKGHNIYNHYNTMPSFIEGYLQAIKDNKDKRFSEEDLRKAIQMSKDIKYVTYSDDDIIDSITK